MKLLLDQNISFKVVEAVERVFPGSRHLRDFGLTRDEDASIWAFAAEKGFTIASKDSDFMHRALLRGHPPKVVYLCLGNCSTLAITCRLLAEEQAIRDFIADPVESLLVIN